MPFVSIPNTLSVALRWTLHGQLCENTFYVISPGGYSVELAETAAEIFGEWVNDTWRGNFSQDVAFNEVYVRGMELADDIEHTAVFAVPILGSRGNSAFPANVALAVQRLTGFTGRDRRGRIFCSGFDDDQITGNTVVTAVASAIVEDLNALNTLLLAEDLINAVVSKKNASGLTPVGDAYAITTWAVRDTYVDSQRRRLTGRGN